MTNEAFSRVKIDAQFKDQGRNIPNADARQLFIGTADKVA